MLFPSFKTTQYTQEILNIFHYLIFIEYTILLNKQLIEKQNQML
jgi:hypothetical protein